MKKITLNLFVLAIFLILVSVLVPGVVLAQETDQTPVQEEKLAEPVRGGLLTGFREWLRLNLLTFDPAKKIELRLKFAEQRISAIQELASQGKVDEKVLERLRRQYQKLQDRATQDMDRIKAQGKDVQALVERLESNALRHRAVLERVFEQVPDQAKDAIRRAIENSERGYQRALEAIQKIREESGEPQLTPEQIRQRIEQRLKFRLPDGSEIPGEIRERIRESIRQRVERGATPTPESEEGLIRPSPPIRPALPPSPPPQRIPQTRTILMTSGGFSPSEITIKAGDTIRFVNQDSQPHWPASGVHPTHQLCPGFDALKGLAQGESYRYTFREAKTCPFHDHLNPITGPKGRITVEP